MASILQQFLVLAALSPILAMAQTANAGPTQTGATFPSMTAIDGLGVPQGGVGSTISSSNPGADGHDQGTFNLSTGGIVGIVVAIIVVVLGIGVMWTLWFIAKRRQWTMKQTLKHASTRVVTAMTPRTPRAPRTPKPDVERGHRFLPGSSRSKSSVPQEGWLADEKEAALNKKPKVKTTRFGTS